MMRGKKKERKKRGQELGSTSSCMYSLIDPSSNTLTIRARRLQLYYWNSVLFMLISEWNLIDYFVVSLSRTFFFSVVFVCLLNAWCSRQFSPGSAMWSSVVSQASACNFSSAAFGTGGNIMNLFFFHLSSSTLFLLPYPNPTTNVCQYALLVEPVNALGIKNNGNLTNLSIQRTGRKLLCVCHQPFCKKSTEE